MLPFGLRLRLIGRPSPKPHSPVADKLTTLGSNGLGDCWVKFFFFFWALLGLLNRACAAGPEGDGWIELDAGMSPARVVLETTDSLWSTKAWKATKQLI